MNMGTTTGMIQRDYWIQTTLRLQFSIPEGFGCRAVYAEAWGEVQNFSKWGTLWTLGIYGAYRGMMGSLGVMQGLF